MNLSSGNSGAILKEAIVKTGPDCQFEAAFCRHLGEKVCPKIYSSWSDGFAMEKLESVPRTPDLLRRIEKLLEENVWNRPSQNFEVTGQDDYLEFQRKMRIRTPDYAKPTEFCLIHGDPTVSNAMVRSDGSLVLIDPRAPNGHIPSAAMVDRGKILQSLFRWETAAYDEPWINYSNPEFLYDPELRKQSMFWLFYHVSRIEQLEISRGWNRQTVLDWCRKTKEKCHE